MLHPAQDVAFLVFLLDMRCSSSANCVHKSPLSQIPHRPILPPILNAPPPFSSNFPSFDSLRKPFPPTSLPLLPLSLPPPADVTETFGRRLMDTLLLRNLAISLPIGTATGASGGGGGGGGGPLLGAWGRTDSSMSDATDAQTVRRRGERGEERMEEG